jgi:hypothetical protein
MPAVLLAHIAGIPVEETALSLGPFIAVTSVVVGARLRQLSERRRHRTPPHAAEEPDRDCRFARRQVALSPPMPDDRRGQPTASVLGE